MLDNPLAARVLGAMADAVVAGDAAGRVRLWNPGAQRLFGWREADVLGRAFPGVPDEPAEREQQAALAKVMAGEDVSLVTKLRKADGHLVEVWIVYSPTRAWLDGPVDGWLAVARDATQQRAVRRALGRAELGVLELLANAAGAALANARAYDRTVRQHEHERAVVDATLDGMAVLDRQGLVRQWNPAAHELTGLPAEEAFGQRLPFPAPEPGVVEEHQLPSGRWLEVLSAPIGSTGEIVVDFRDVSRTKAIEESKDLFLAIASHELRTPITVVQGYASTLLTHWDGLTDDERRGSVQRIADRTKALAALVQQLLLGAQAGLAMPAQVDVPFDLGGLLRTAVAGFAT